MTRQGTGTGARAKGEGGAGRDARSGGTAPGGTSTEEDHFHCFELQRVWASLLESLCNNTLWGFTSLCAYPPVLPSLPCMHWQPGREKVSEGRRGKGCQPCPSPRPGLWSPWAPVLTSADLEEDIEHDCGVDSLAFLYEVHDRSVLVRPEHQVHHVLSHFLSLLAPLRLGVHQSQQVRMPNIPIT